MVKKIIFLGVIIAVVVIIGMALTGNRKDVDEQRATSNEQRIKYYTCGMHPSVKISPEEYNKGNVNCPICNMKLTPVYKEEARGEGGNNYHGCGMEGEEHVFLIDEEQIKNCPICGMPLKKLSGEEADRLRGVVSRVQIKGEQARLAGIRTEPVRSLHLSKEIRTVGKVAYDPALVIAQEEFISSLEAFDKIQKGKIEEIKERASKLVESSRRKLLLLGLSSEQIKELESTREIHTSLILPEEKMWIYGDVYEYELSWVKVGNEVKVATPSLPGEKFTGVIASINPVLDSKTRSIRFRAEIDNHDLKLKPEMYVDVFIKSMYVSPDGEHMVLAIPKDAILDTGVRKIVWISKEGGNFEGRTVEVGPEATAIVNGEEKKVYPVLKGLSEGLQVVTKANFLIDSQSQITGVAAAAYGGALDADEKKGPVGHQH